MVWGGRKLKSVVVRVNEDVSVIKWVFELFLKSERKSLNVDLGRKRGGYVVKSRVFDFL